MLAAFLLASVAVADCWHCDPGVTVTPCEAGVVVAMDARAPDTAWAALPLSLPTFGPEVVEEIDVENVGALPSGGNLFIEQLDAAGQTLPETLADVRWTTHIRPVGKKIAYRARGRLHPQAKALRLKVELRRETGDYGLDGLRLADPTARLPRLRVTHVALSPAKPRPVNPSFFCSGASGKPGDTALVLGGPHAIALEYQTRSRGSWAGGYEFTDERAVFYPAGPGTLAASFRVGAGELPETMTLFDAYNGFQLGELHTKTQGKGIGSVLKLTYSPRRRQMALEMQDYLAHRFAATFDGVSLPVGKWTSVAVRWTPGAQAVVSVGGRDIGSVSLAGYRAVDLKDPSFRNVNDAHAMMVFLGASFSDTRGRKRGKPIVTMFQGAVDDFQVLRGAKQTLPAPGLTPDTAALFTFDHGYDGVSAGGYGFVRASLYADCSRETETAPALAGRHDPRNVFNLDNFRTMPTEAQFAESRRHVRRQLRLRPGESARVAVPAKFYMDAVEISNVRGTRPLVYPRLVRKGRVDPASFADIRASMDLAGLPDEEKVNRVFQYVIGASDYFINNQVAFKPGSDVPYTAIFNALAMLNSYCGFECGPLNNMAANLFVAVADCPAGTQLGYGHMFEEVFFGGKNHIYDLSAQKFFPAYDNVTSAGLREMCDEPGLFNRMGAAADHFIRKGTRAPRIKDMSLGAKLAVTLNPGECMRWWTSNDGQMNNLQTLSRGTRGNRNKNSVDKDERDYARLVHADDAKWMVFRRDRLFPQFATAILSFAGEVRRDNPAFVDLGAAGFAYRVKSPYPIVRGAYVAELKNGTTARVEISTDEGKTYRPMKGTVSEYAVKARTAYLVKVCAPMADVRRFRATTEMMFNPRTFAGWLTGGTNQVTLKGEGEAAEVTLFWREPAKPLRIATDLPRVASGTIPGFERQFVLVDPAQPWTCSVDGASAAATVRTKGPLQAQLANGKLTLSYHRNGERLFPRGDDNPEPMREFPALGVVEIVDGDCVKSLTAVIAPQARLIAPAKPIRFEQARQPVALPIADLPKGRYAIFALARFPGAQPQFGPALEMANPAGGAWVPIAKYRNSAFDYYKAGYAAPGERARWKWDTAADPKQVKASPASAYSFRFFSAPRGELRFRLTSACPGGVELAAVLVVPAPDLEAQLDLKRILFGVNCQPELVQ